MGGLRGSAGWVVLGRGWRLRGGLRRGAGRGVPVCHLSGFGDCSSADPRARKQRQLGVEDLPSLEPDLVFACWAADERGACFVDQPGCTVLEEQRLPRAERDVLGGVPVSSFLLCRERLGWWAAWPWGHRKHFSVLDAWHSSAPSGREQRGTFTTGSATPGAASLHPWLHSSAPSGLDHARAWNGGS
jgi:hypothetical protein